VEILLYLGAAIELIVGAVVIVSVFVETNQDSDFKIFEVMVASLLILLGLFNAFLAHGIGRGKEWARAVYVVLQLLTVLGGVASFADGQRSSLAFIVVPLLLIFLLFTRSSRRYFADND